VIPPERSLRVASYLTNLLIGGLVLLPVLLVIWTSFRSEDGFTLAAYAPLWHSARPWALFRNSLLVSTNAAMLGTVIGTLMAVVAQTLPGKLRALFLIAGSLPFLIPPYITATAWIEWAGRRGIIRTALAGPAGADTWLTPYSVIGAALVLALTYYPIVMVLAIVAIEHVNRRALEAAWLIMGPRRALWRISLPCAVSGIATGAFLVFMLALANFSVPSLLLVDVYPVEVHTQFSAFYNAPRATAAALPLVLLAAAGMASWGAVVHGRRAWLSSRERRPPLYRPAPQPLLLAVAAAAVLLGVVAPLMVLLDRAGSWETYRQVWATAREEILTSLVLATVSAAVLAIAAWRLAYLAHYVPGTRWTARATVLAFVVSGPLFGIGLIIFWNRHDWRGWVYDSVFILVVACVARYLFFAYQAAAAALRSLNPALEEAAAVAGVAWWRRFLGIVAPMTFPWAVACWGVFFVLVFGDADAIVLVAPPGITPLPARLHSLMHYGPSEYVAALSLMVVAIIAVSAGASGVGFWLLRRGWHERDRAA
jgi:iron(III) transport system permease protein